MAAAEGIRVERMPLAEAADWAVSQLEHRCAAGLPPNPRNRAASAEPLLERAYARALARMPAARYEQRLQVCS